MRRLTSLPVAVLVLAACGGGSSIEIGGGGTSTPGQVYACGAERFTEQELADAPPATELGEEGRAALAGAEVGDLDPADGWVVLTESDAEVGLIRPLDEPEPNGPGALRTHEFVHLQRISGATNVPDGTWMLDAAGTCTPRAELDGLDAADLTLTAEPSATSTALELGVYERACASGQPATGRVEVVSQTLTDDELRLVVGVRPQGEHTRVRATQPPR